MQDPASTFLDHVTTRLPLLVESAHDGPIAEAAAIVAESIAEGGIVHAFGTGHSEAFAMEIAGRAGGLIPTSRIMLRDLVLRGSHPIDDLSGPQLERDATVADELFSLAVRDTADVFMIASHSGVHASVVGLAQAVKDHDHPLIAVTSLDHTTHVSPQHPSGKRLCEIADVVIDNLAPYGDTTTELPSGLVVGAVSTITSAFIAQLLTMRAVELLCERNMNPPVYVSANVPGGYEHNRLLRSTYEGRLHLYG